MAAGLPISLLRTPDYEERAAQADAFRGQRRLTRRGASHNAADPLTNIYAGRVEQQTFAIAVQAFNSRPDLFERVFGNTEASVYRVR